MDFHPPPPPVFWHANDIYHPGPIFTPPVFTNLLYICKDHVGANSFFLPSDLYVKSAGSREEGARDDSLPGPHFKVIFDGAPSLFEGFE